MAIVVSNSVPVGTTSGLSSFYNVADYWEAAQLSNADISLVNLSTVRVTASADFIGFPSIRIDLTGSFGLSLSGQPSGTITGITVSYDNPATVGVVDYVVAGTITGLSVAVPALLDTLRDGDVLGLEDLLFGGADSMTGAAGIDVLAAGAGADTVRGEGGDDVIFGGLNNDRVYGGDGNDELHGDDPYLPGGGNDMIFGDAGNDAAWGGRGNDLICGGTGDDLLVGGAGNDILQGDAGADVLLGGTGADLFRFRRTTDSIQNPAGRDVVRDFRPGEGDRIDLSFLDGNAGLAGVQGLASASFLGTAAFGTNTPGQVRFDAITGGVVLQANTDNDSAAELVVIVRGVTALTAADFVWSA